jgi:DNA-binding PadR family transcriptional regulator
MAPPDLPMPPRRLPLVPPLKPIVLEILFVLFDAERHGWDIVREIERRRGGRVRILPGNLYRSLREMLADGLIEESARRPDPALDDERRCYYRVTRAGREVARAEARRLEAVLSEARALKLLAPGGR